jgi:ribonuclease VapC
VIVDTSALLAILKGEADSDAFAQALAGSPSSRISAGTLLETAIVVDANGDPVLSARLDQLVETASLEVVEVSAEHVRLARQAYRDYGRGSGHRAALNFGDCFAYALARATGEPLLFKGEDFSHTDVTSAL